MLDVSGSLGSFAKRSVRAAQAVSFASSVTVVLVDVVCLVSSFRAAQFNGHRTTGQVAVGSADALSNAQRGNGTGGKGS